MPGPDLLRLLCVNAYRLYTATLMGNPSKSTRQLQETLTTLRPGDLVMEITTIGNAERDQHRLGRLLRVEWRPARREPDDGERVEDIPKYRYWIIETLAGDEYTWENATFIRVLDTPWEPPAGERHIYPPAELGPAEKGGF